MKQKVLKRLTIHHRSIVIQDGGRLIVGKEITSKREKKPLQSSSPSRAGSIFL
jgi:hypothetical protein